jgi:aspartyl protease family protein
MGPDVAFGPAPTCHLHPQSASVTACHECLAHLCDACAVYADGRHRCASCARSHHRRRRLTAVLVAAAALLGVGALAGGAGLAWWTFRSQVTGEVDRRTAAVDAAPCDQEKVLELAEFLVGTGDNAAALDRCEAYFAACGEFPRLRWVTYEAHKRRSEWDLAAAEATRLIEDAPWDADYRWWRGIAYEQAGEDERAIEDYRQAIALRPAIDSIPLNLAGLLERQGKPCEALLPIEQALFHHPEVANAGELRARIDAISRAGSCDATTDRIARIRVDRRAGAMLARVRIDGHEGTFLVDTGASYVTLGGAFARKLGVGTDGPEVLLATAGGQEAGHLAVVHEIDVEGVTANVVPVVVIDGLAPGVDGLLGLSFLARFDLATSGDVLEIRPRR